jgi:hypothetical protein
MARKRIEEKHQAAFVHWFRIQYPKYEKLLSIIANGENVGARRMTRLKQLGLVPGMPDLIIFIARKKFHGLFIEMKQPDGHLQQNQVEVHAELKKQKYRVVTAYGWEEAKAEILDYLAEDRIFRM